MSILKGNVYNASKNHDGWFVGHFIKKYSPLRTKQVEIKWINRKKGIIKKGLQTSYNAQTIIILIKGKMVFRFQTSKLKCSLSKEGDFISFNSKDDSHESETLKKSKAIVIKWPSLP